MAQTTIVNPGIFPETRISTSDPKEMREQFKLLAARSRRTISERLAEHEQQAVGLLMHFGAQLARIKNGLRVVPRAAGGIDGPAPGMLAGPPSLPESSRRRAAERMWLDASRVLDLCRSVRDALDAGNLDFAMGECLNIGSCTAGMAARPYEYAAMIGANRLKGQISKTANYRAQMKTDRRERAEMFFEIRRSCTSDHDAHMEVASMLGGCARTVRRAVVEAIKEGRGPGAGPADSSV